MTISRRSVTTQTQLPRRTHAATQHSMRGRFTSLLVLIGLFFGIVVMPAMAHASGHSPVHASEMLDVHEIGPEIDNADHSQPASGDTDMPCHTVSHHHCSVALAPDADSGLLANWSADAALMPLVVQPMPSLALAPPTEPPAA
jgi:hypothetical protein